MIHCVCKFTGKPESKTSDIEVDLSIPLSLSIMESVKLWSLDPMNSNLAGRFLYYRILEGQSTFNEIQLRTPDSWKSALDFRNAEISNQYWRLGAYASCVMLFDLLAVRYTWLVLSGVKITNPPVENLSSFKIRNVYPNHPAYASRYCNCIWIRNCQIKELFGVSQRIPKSIDGVFCVPEVDKCFEGC